MLDASGEIFEVAGFGKGAGPVFIAIHDGRRVFQSLEDE